MKRGDETVVAHAVIAGSRLTLSVGGVRRSYSWATEGARPVRKVAGRARDFDIQRKHAVSIEMQHCIEPRLQFPGLAGRALTSCLGDAILDFNNAHR